jgi:hypothetical protein
VYLDSRESHEVLTVCRHSWPTLPRVARPRLPSMLTAAPLRCVVSAGEPGSPTLTAAAR